MKRFNRIPLRPIDQDVDPTPMTREGARALVERFHALNRPQRSLGLIVLRVAEDDIDRADQRSLHVI